MTTQLPPPTIPFKKQLGFYPFHTKEPLSQSLLRTNSLLIIGYQELYDWMTDHIEAKKIVMQHVCTACDAYQTMDESQVELVISDIGLPDESGWLLAAKLQISHPASQVWLHVDMEAAANNHNPWSGITFADQLVCTDNLFQPTLRKCS